MLDGTVAAAPANMLIYATSNRRHLLPEYLSENLETKHVGEEVHPGESVEEKISLSERFGVWISFYPFSQDDYLAAVAAWLARIRRSGGENSARSRSASARRAAVRAAAGLPQRPHRLAVRPRLRGRRRMKKKSRDACRSASSPLPRPSSARPTARYCWRSVRRASRLPATGSSRAASSSQAKVRATRLTRELAEELG